MIGARFEIAGLFVGQAASNAGATIELTAALILVGASFFMTDALQSIAAGGLRGLKDTRVPLLFAAVAYWLIGLSLSYVLGFKTGLGAIGIWVGLSIGKAVYAALLVLRLQLLTNRPCLAGSAMLQIERQTRGRSQLQRRGSSCGERQRRGVRYLGNGANLFATMPSALSPGTAIAKTPLSAPSGPQRSRRRAWLWSKD